MERTAQLTAHRSWAGRDGERAPCAGGGEHAGAGGPRGATGTKLWLFTLAQIMHGKTLYCARRDFTSNWLNLLG